MRAEIHFWVIHLFRAQVHPQMMVYLSAIMALPIIPVIQTAPTIKAVQWSTRSDTTWDCFTSGVMKMPVQVMILSNSPEAVFYRQDYSTRLGREIQAQISEIHQTRDLQQ